MNKQILAFIALAVISISTASARLWKSADGTKSFKGEYDSIDGEMVTIIKGGKKITFPISKLHADDQEWIKRTENPIPPKNAVFDHLSFGDTKDTVLKKLKRSKIVKTDLADALTGRTGLNGIFATKQKVGGFTYTLYFDWDSAERLREVTLRSEPSSEQDYDSKLKESWSSMVELVGSMHGKPATKNPYPKITSMKEGIALNSHMWRIRTGGSALVGIGLNNKKYILTLRITRESI